jgi:transcriptional regulator with XRE-family HTH domain
MKVDEEIGLRIKKLRLEKGKSQEQLGKILRCSHAAISDIERGKTKLSVEDLLTLAKFFEVNLSEIIGDAAEVKPIPMFSYGRGSFGTQDEKQKEIDNARKKFRELAQKKAKDEKK